MHSEVKVDFVSVARLECNYPVLVFQVQYLRLRQNHQKVFELFHFYLDYSQPPDLQ